MRYAQNRKPVRGRVRHDETAADAERQDRRRRAAQRSLRSLSEQAAAYLNQDVPDVPFYPEGRS